MISYFSVFEQESHAFSRFLPGFLIPHPLAYCERTDSFVTLSSAFQVESYGYSQLAVKSGASMAASTNEHEQPNSKRVNADWSVGIGSDEAINIEIVAPASRELPSQVKPHIHAV